MKLRTPLYDTHCQSGAKMVEFGGWSMPLHYGSQLDEHHAVRRQAGMFDVSHMARIDLHGPGTRAYLRDLLANNVDKLREPGAALYSCMLNPSGGIMDDLIVYFLEPGRFRLVVNAATRDKDSRWITETAAAHSDVNVEPRDDLAMIAVQGPQARDQMLAALKMDEQTAARVRTLKPFNSIQFGDWLLCCTGYTGEDGFEIMLPGDRASTVWQSLAGVEVQPCGLGARDTLRLEAGLNLYGMDMDESTTPLTSGLAWTVAWQPADRDFVGRAALEAQRAAGLTARLAGIVLEGRGVLRAQQVLRFDRGMTGTITSGSYSPTLERSIGLARIPAAVSPGSAGTVEIRDRQLPVTVVKPPFVRFGKSRL